MLLTRIITKKRLRGGKKVENHCYNLHGQNSNQREALIGEKNKLLENNCCFVFHKGISCINYEQEVGCTVAKWKN
jgi:hypothetical protein